ncbi:MAG: protein kinase [Candidatus Hydrogenedentes bacterium]|nr:protein kinase [Candidatus Hydrogenedentota bacterium]
MSGGYNTARASTLFGQYNILETLGHGGMGVVYRAHDTSLDRIVALKVLREDLRTQKHVVARFQREAEAIAMVTHPNIVHIYSVGAVGKIPYLAMEYIEGDPLSKVMQRERQLPWETVFDVGEQVARALASAHEANIIHRDIKPGNVLVDKEWHAVVTDFGVAKILTAETQLTVDGSRLGTPQYMSPERCLNKEITTSSDIYSLGVLMFQMIAGRLPYRAKDPIELLRKIVSTPPARLRDYMPDIPDDVERLVAHMIEKNPDDRPPSADDLAELIARVRAGKPLVEEDDGMSAAMDELRDSIATPTPGYGLLADVYGPSSIHEKVMGVWRRLPGWAHLAIPMFLLFVVGAFLGTYLADYMSRDFASDSARSFDASIGRWLEPMDIARFVDESPGVTLVPFSLPKFTIASGGWMDGPTGVIGFNGIGRTSRAHQSAIGIVDPVTRTAVLCVPPTPGNGSAEATRLLAYANGVAGPGSLNGSFLFRVSEPAVGGTRASERIMAASLVPGSGNRWVINDAFASPSADSDHGIPQRIGELAVSPDGKSLAMSVADPGVAGSWRLVERDARLRLTEPLYRELSVPGDAIVWIGYTPDGEGVVYVRESTQGRRTLWHTSARFDTGTELMTGDIYLTHRAINPSGNSLIVSVATGRRSSRIHQVDLMTGEGLADLGDGVAAAWHPSGESVVAIAPDRRGRLQMWMVDAGGDHARRQLTHLDGGVSSICEVSADGEWAFSNAIGTPEPTLVFVRLTPDAG